MISSAFCAEYNVIFDINIALFSETSDSLNEYIRLFKPAWSIRISEKNFGFEDDINSIPLYAAFCIADG